MNSRATDVQKSSTISNESTPRSATHPDAGFAGSEPGPRPERGGSAAIRTLLAETGADVHGLVAACALDEALCAAHDIAAVETALAAWARARAECTTAEFVPHSEYPHGPGNRPPLVETVTEEGHGKLAVAVQGTPAGWVTFTTAIHPSRITDSLRRLILVAARIYASRLAQVTMRAAPEKERDPERAEGAEGTHLYLGSSAAAQELARLIPKLAASNATVLLMGETGVGKTFVARLIHESGVRKGEPLRVINCASIPENLVESELFGHTRGAFTGAVSDQAGAFEAAGRGTVLLDEIGELPLASQAKLLRVLEDRRFERLGSNRSLPLEARILVATNRDLEAMIAAGTFRSDLFFRISVVKALVPPLRERGQDLVMLAKQLLSDLSANSGRRVDGFSPESLEIIRGYSWPGNVRELRNAIEHALVLGDGPLVLPRDFPIGIRRTRDHSAQDEQPSVIQLPAQLEWLERRAIEEALRVAHGNRARAAALLGIRPATLYYKLRQDSSLERSLTAPPE
ncbi:sigma-54 interaction domain-containing protein [Pendulispora albinea]|uniref:Sigma-54 dependent transcriptional regulator n=1 Tax=Pendulispora albinea TaxID=2741071 RepID=A0ABZ2M256_9BACT